MWTNEPAGKDGRALITERHGDVVAQYLWDKSIDAQAVHDERALAIAEDAARQEQAEQERQAASESVAAALDAAVKAGTLDAAEVLKAGMGDVRAASQVKGGRG